MAVPAPDSSPWTQQPRVSQQAICPPSLSRGLRWRSACWLHAVASPLPLPTECGLLEAEGAKSSLFRNSSPPPRTSSTWRCQTPTAWKAPQTQGGRVFPMQISSQVGETCAPPFPGRSAVAAVADGCKRYRPLPWAMRWSLSVWPLCRCHSDSYGNTAAWRRCPEGRAHHRTGQGEGTSSSW